MARRHPGSGAYGPRLGICPLQIPGAGEVPAAGEFHRPHARATRLQYIPHGNQTRSPEPRSLEVSREAYHIVSLYGENNGLDAPIKVLWRGAAAAGCTPPAALHGLWTHVQSQYRVSSP